VLGFVAKGQEAKASRPFILAVQLYRCTLRFLKRRCAARAGQKWLERLNVGSLQTLGAADNLEFNGLPLVEGAVAVRLDGGEMDENVLAALALDKSKALAGIKPLHCSLFFHRCVPLNEKAI
jgi:hypothetical protein